VLPRDRVWRKNSGASPEQIEALRQASPVKLPAKYYDFLAFSDGGEGPLSRQPLNFVLDPAAVALENFSRGLSHEFFPSFLMFGSNGAGEYLAFDVRDSGRMPIVSIDMTNTDLGESVWQVAASFDEFVELVGLDPPTNDAK